MSSRWVADAESAIFTIIRSKVKKEYKTKYPDLFFTRDEDNDELPNNVYPTCYIHFSEAETGNDLSQRTVNAVYMTMDVDVVASETMGIDGVMDVIYSVLDVAKSFGFRVSMMPERITSESDIYRMIAKLSRIVGYNDVLFK